MTKETMEKAQDVVSNVVSNVQQQATSQLSGQIAKAASSLGSVASAVTSVSRELRTQDQAWLAQFADQAASRVEDFAHQLEGKDFDQLLYETERFARRQPAVFLGSAFMLGILAARFFKSSAPRSYYSPREHGSYYGNPTHHHGNPTHHFERQSHYPSQPATMRSPQPSFGPREATGYTPTWTDDHDKS